MNDLSQKVEFFKNNLPQEDLKEVSTIPEMGFYYRETATSHEYYYDKKRMTGVTTILGTIAKPNLIKWAAEMSSNYLKDVYNSFKKLTPANFEEAIDAHTRKKKAAADVGTLVHDACEKYLKIGEMPNFLPSTIEMKCFENFRDWWVSKPRQLIASEELLYDLELWYGGKCDLVYWEDGMITFGDIKTSSAKKDYKTGKYSLYGREYFAQCAAYQNAWLKLHPEVDSSKVAKRTIIRVGKDGTFDVHDSYNYEQDFLIFLAALMLNRLNK